MCTWMDDISSRKKLTNHQCNNDSNVVKSKRYMYTVNSS